jgi:hypothetical protein
MKNIVSLMCLVMVFGCPAPEDTTEITLTNYHQDIKPLLDTKCMSCHREGDIGLFPFETFEQVNAMGPAIVAAVENRTMPPWGQDPSCRPSQDSLWLDANVIDVFSQWKEHGFEEGTPSDTGSAVEQAIEETELVEPDTLIGTADPYVPDVGLADDYRCFILPHEFDKTTFVYQNTIYPDRLDLVHHVIVYVGTPDDRTYFENRDAQSETPGFPCFGGSGVDNAQMLGGWAPGEFAANGNKEYAHQISKGSVLIMQMHFNLAGKTIEDVMDGDQTQLALWTLDEGETPEYLISLMPVVDLGINIPPNEPAWTEESFRRLPLDATIIGTAPHMHLLGSSIKMELIREDESVECLTEVNDWDFGWQRTYMYPEDHTLPITINDQLRLECTYDNSEGNQPILGGEKQTPQQTEWGDGTRDEMCLDYLVLAAPYRGEGQDGFCAGFENCLHDCPENDAFCALACPGTLGVQCLSCSIDGFFGSCAQSKCGVEMIGFGSCYDNCDTGTYFDFFECIHGACREPFAEFYACMDPYLRDGTCADDFSDCTGMYTE